MPFLAVPFEESLEVIPLSFELPLSKCNDKEPSLIEPQPLLIRGEFIAYSSPDCSYSVIEDLFNNAKREILIGLFDFSSHDLKDLLLNARDRNVNITLMVDKLGSKSEDEDRIFSELNKSGCFTVYAPSCSNPSGNRYYPTCHAKIIIVDAEWTLIQSANFSENGVPKNKCGNRETGVAIHSEKLANFFIDLVMHDIKLSQEKQDHVKDRLELMEFFLHPELIEFAPSQPLAKIFSKKSFNPQYEIKVTPILSPDNYMPNLIPELLKGAKKSIYIEQQYIKSGQSEIGKLLEAIKKAAFTNPELDIRIILAERGTEEKHITILKEIYGLSLDKNIRFIDTSRFVHCHNKMIIVDNESVLIGSQNWSNTGVSEGREASLLIEFPGLAEYYAEMFESDWSTGSKEFSPYKQSAIAYTELRSGDFVKVVTADYLEV